MTNTNKLVLIDGNSIAYRAFFALPLLNNDKGVYTNANLWLYHHAVENIGRGSA